MRIIGLTGGIASGKSTIAAFLKELGAEVIDADQLARETVMKGSQTLDEIIRFFGKKVLAPDGSLNRTVLGQIIFADAAARKKLEAITHPAIRRVAEERLQALRDSGQAVTFYMAPLLLEAGITDRVDEIWVVYVDRETQIQRLVARDGISKEDACRKIESQMPMDEKVKYAKIVINNAGTLQNTKMQVLKAWEDEIGYSK